MKKENLLAEVVVDIPARRVDRIFHYRIPPELAASVQEGVRVEVPFGSRRSVEGFVVGLEESAQAELSRGNGLKDIDLRDIARVIDEIPPVTPDLLALARWMSQHYLCPLVTSLQCLLPQGVKRRQAGEKKVPHWRLTPDFTCHLEQKITAKQQKVMTTLHEHGPLPTGELQAKAGVGKSVITTLAGKGIIENILLKAERDPMVNTGGGGASAPEGFSGNMAGFTLTPEQDHAIGEITKALVSGKPRTYLLHGVTGSGKTEVYLQIIARVLALGKQAILLVPEISLTPQVVEVFRWRFGSDVAILHSRLSQGERFDQWRKIRRGEVRVAVGARSAVFAPLPELGLIILDEEHETSYKQEENPRYQTRDVAIKRAELCNATVVLGSATPSLESYYEATRKKYTLLTLPKRIDDLPLPPVKLVDMRTELAEGNRSIFSRLLADKIREGLARKEQTIIFLNRRGYATFVVCRECGLSLKCPRCAVSLTYHAGSETLCCHYCRFTRRIPRTCPRCGSRHIRYFGTGTQKVEEYLAREFPGARVLRMDVDTTRRKGAHAEILGAFRRREADILVGTQMIAKGLDIPNVTLVGVITADTSLNMPDFRAAERTFQLLTQVAGRAGRGQAGGEVVVQSYMPDHYSIKTAQNHDFNTFYRLEMAQRRAFGYPPLSRVVRIIISGGDENMVRETATKLGDHFRHGQGKEGLAVRGGLTLLGPAPAPVPRVKEKFRWNLVLLGADLEPLREEILAMLNEIPTGRDKVLVSVDIDAQNMM